MYLIRHKSEGIKCISGKRNSIYHSDYLLLLLRVAGPSLATGRIILRSLVTLSISIYIVFSRFSFSSSSYYDSYARSFLSSLHSEFIILFMAVT